MSASTGIIVMFSGLIANIPSGWLLCDGTYGTPDLRSKFVRGAAGEGGGSGGADEHTHDFTGDGHSHTFGAGSGLETGVNKSDTSNTVQVTGTTDLEDCLPPYYELLFVMKS